MAESTNPELESVDSEYRQAQQAFYAARARLRDASEARTSAHRMEELKRSQLAQTAAGLSDEEWAALRQHILAAEPIEAAATLQQPAASQAAMPNRAAEIRAAIQAEHPGALIQARGDRWLRHLLPNGDFALDVALGRLHYSVAATALRSAGNSEIQTDYVDATVPDAEDEVTTAPYLFYQQGGDRRIYPRRDVQTEYIELGRPEFQRPNLSWAAIPWDGKTRTANLITYHRPDARLEIITGPERLKINLVLLSQPSSSRWRFPATLVGLTRQGRSVVADSDGAAVAWMAAFTLEDAAGVARAVPDQLGGHPTYQGAYIIEPDLAGLQYPVTIDPTIDVNLAANADDGVLTSTPDFNNSGVEIPFGRTGGISYHYFGRFAGVTVPPAAVISSAYLTFVAYASFSTTGMNTLISGADEDNSAQMTGAADALSRPLTTANTAWAALPAWTAGTAYQTPSIVGIVQEIVDRAGWASGNAMQFLVKDNGSTADHFRRIAAMEHTTYAPAALHVVYSGSKISANVLAIPRILNQPAGIARATVAVGLPAFPQLRTLNAPAGISRGGTAIVANHLAGVATLNQPAGILRGATSISLPALAQPPTMQPPAIQPGALSIIGPTPIPPGAIAPPPLAGIIRGAVAINLGTIPAATAVYDPSILAAQTIAADTIPSATALYPPSLATGAVAISLPAVPVPRTIQPPSIAPGAVAVAPNPIAAPVALYPPTIQPRISLNPIPAATALYPPSLAAAGISISIPAIGAATALYGPAVSPGIATIALGAFPLPRTPNPPSIVPGVATVILGALGIPLGAYAPAVTRGAVAVAISGLAAPRALHLPGVITDAGINLGTIDPATALYAPAIIGDALITLAPIGPATQLYAPLVFGDSSIMLGTLVGATVLYAPAIGRGAVSIGLGTIPAGTALYAPAIMGDASIALGALVRPTALYPPSLISGAGLIALGEIAAETALYDPQVTAGAAQVALGTIVGAGVRYAPEVRPSGILVALGALPRTLILYAPADIYYGGPPIVIGPTGGLLLGDGRLGGWLILDGRQAGILLVPNGAAGELIEAGRRAGLLLDDGRRGGRIR